VYRGPQAVPQLSQLPVQHAPNAALLIDFDNVTMGIRSDLAGELRNLLSSEIIKGKVAVQRAYADWRRYPQYIVPLAEASIDMIMAPAYGTSKKNATDIRLSVDAMELVFTRSEIGTYILLSGDSDFASLVTKLKEYGKYVIGVGIRESSSDLLVMNCDEYYSYNALAGLVKAGEEEVVKWDPWELVTEAINRMVKNGDVMRSDRLKQVMQDIDPAFDEKNLGMSKFSKFCQEASSQGLIKVTKLENGQLEVAPPDEAHRAGATPPGGARPAAARPAAARTEDPLERVNGGHRGRRGGRNGRGGRGRGHERDERTAVTPITQPVVTPEPAPPAPAVAATPSPEHDEVGRGGERLTRDEAFDLLRRAVSTFASSDGAIPAAALRRRAFELLGHDSESLNDRNFTRVLRDAHDADIIDLRRRGDDYEVALPTHVAPVAEQLNRAAAAHAATQLPPAAGVPTAGTPRGMGPRGIPGRGRPGSRLSAPPPELLSVGVVEEPAVAAPEPPAVVEKAVPAKEARRRGGRARARGSRPKEGAEPKATPEAGTAAAEPGVSDKGKPRRPRSKKGASREAAA
jgi:uncharacterized LabA/DUF88 family protein